MAWSDFFLPSGAQRADEAQANYERQQRELEAQTARRIEDNTIDVETVRINNQLSGVPLDDQDAAAASGFSEGLQEGRANIDRAFISGVGNFLSLVPRFVWVLGAVGLFLYLGGGAMLLRRGKGAFSK